jgi:hypothetical protein
MVLGKKAWMNCSVSWVNNSWSEKLNIIVVTIFKIVKFLAKIVLKLDLANSIRNVVSSQIIDGDNPRVYAGIDEKGKREI